MLKVRNHREGFEDSMKSDDIDTVIFSGSSDRTKNTKTTYTIEAQTGSHIFTVGPDEHLILPLFVGNGNILAPGSSKDPSFNSAILPTKNFRLQTTSTDISKFKNRFVKISHSKAVCCIINYF